MPGARDVGIALAERRVSAWLPNDGAGERWERSLPPPDLENGRWPELESALVELAERIDGAPRLCVALLPPLAQVRCIPLPRMRATELLHLLRRDLSRYFPVAGDMVVGAERPPGAAPLPVLATIAHSPLLAALHAAADGAGAELERVVPAHAAWRSAALATWPALRAGPSVLLVSHGDLLELLHLANGWPSAYRRLPATTSAERVRELLTDANGAFPPVAFVGDAAAAAALAASGVSLLAGAPADWAGGAADVAARHAPFARAPELVPEDVRKSRATAERRWVARLGAASLACLALAGALELWGTRREAAALEHRRAAIRVSVEQAVAVRDSATVVVDRLAALQSLQETAPRWSALVTMLAARLPDDAYLLSLRAEGDSASLDGIAGSAADVVSALRSAPEVASVRADAPIRQELGAGGALVERFALTVRLARVQRDPRASTVARLGAR